MEAPCLADRGAAHPARAGEPAGEGETDLSTLRIYELINPSDAITFEATEAEAGVIAEIMRASMMFVKDAETGASPECADFAAERDAIWTSKDRLASYVRAWESFMVASPRDRRMFKQVADKMTPEAARVFAAEWHEERCTSLNDICGQVWRSAAKMRARGVDRAEASAP